MNKIGLVHGVRAFPINSIVRGVTREPYTVLLGCRSEGDIALSL